MEERLTHLPVYNSLFSHDGIRDSQTHLAAPTLFYELLRRQVALSSRSQKSFSAIKITFMRRELTEKPQTVSAEDILKFSVELRTLTRSEDCIGRLGINECVVLIAEGEQAARQFVSRLQSASSLSLKESLSIGLSMVTSLRGETGLELLNRLDEAPLSTH
jgi:hypothetical protein